MLSRTLTNSVLFMACVLTAFTTPVATKIAHQKIITTVGSTDSVQLHSIINTLFEYDKKETPIYFAGGENDISPTEIGHFAPADFARRAAFYEKQVEGLNKIKVQNLGWEDQINRELLLFSVEDAVKSYKNGLWMMPLLSDEGPHIDYASLPSHLTFRTVADYEHYIARLTGFPNYMKEWMETLREGVRRGFTTPKIILSAYDVTWRQQYVTNADSSVFFKPFLTMPSSISEADKKRLIQAGRSAIMESIDKTYRQFGAFMENEYRPACRTTIGASALPDGAAFYQQRVHYFTTLDMTAKEIHELGLKEVARIQAEMESIIKEVGFKGSFREFLDNLRSDPQFYAKTPQELLEKASFIAKKADGQLPRFFGKLPRQPYTVAPVPDYLAPIYTGGRYVPSPINGTSPGTYWVNTYDLKSRPLYVLESLTLHEAVPGHHLQGSLTQELKGFPRFRQNLYINAFGEGWGLYCEHLGIEMGFYQSPYSRFGRLTYEMWRASRLVVDTGIHQFGWTREQVIAYLSSHTALSLHECTTETDRYIAWPGQALSYKIGELKIRELRAHAEKTMGERFDIRRFHDALLSEGTVTMGILEKLVARFEAAQ